MLSIFRKKVYNGNEVVVRLPTSSSYRMECYDKWKSKIRYEVKEDIVVWRNIHISECF